MKLLSRSLMNKYSKLILCEFKKIYSKLLQSDI